MAECTTCGKSVSLWSKLRSSVCPDCQKAQDEKFRLQEEERLRKELEAQETKVVKGKRIACPICGHDRFQKERILMNTRGATFMNMDWANSDAETCACRSCGYVLWFRG